MVRRLEGLRMESLVTGFTLMSLSSLFSALVLFGFGAFLLFGVVYLMVAPLVRTLSTGKGGGKIRRAAVRLATVDSLLERGDFPSAYKLLKKSVFLDTKVNPAQLLKLRDLYQGFLARVLNFSELYGSRVTNLASLEYTLLQRVELLTLRHKARASYKGIQQKREGAGKKLPEWTKNDFDKKFSDIQAELQQNTADCNKELQVLFSTLMDRSSANVFYH